MNVQRFLTDELVVNSVLEVILRDGVLPVDYLQLSALLEGVLLKTQQVEDTTQCLERERDTHRHRERERERGK